VLAAALETLSRFSDFSPVLLAAEAHIVALYNIKNNSTGTRFRVIVILHQDGSSALYSCLCGLFN
jgi:hypothetical protein